MRYKGAPSFEIMSIEKSSQAESLEAWLSAKPYWEQYVWRINLEKESLTEEDIDQAYELLCEHLGLISPLSGEKPPISFKHQIAATPPTSDVSLGIKIREVKEIVDVNAIPVDSSVKFGPNLTLIYGANGSGKSGIGRLLCNACFSRGDREILPNVKTASLGIQSLPKATFIVEDSSGKEIEIHYTFGESNDFLKRFSVFDSKSVLIHLDRSNNINFTPAQVRIFDKVADTISQLEGRITNERNKKKKDNPFLSMFLDDATSDTALFCKRIDASTKEADFLRHAAFDPKTDGPEITRSESQIEEKKKLDIPRKRSTHY
jgi:hypothetical protein